MIRKVKLLSNRNMIKFFVPLFVALLFFQGGLLSSATPKVIDDVAMKARFQRGLETLAEGKKGTSLAELNKQLNRKKAKVDMPENKPSWFSPDELYERCRSSVLMIGRIYKCDKCTKWHVGSASAFALTSDGVIVTNYHVIEEKDGATLGKRRKRISGLSADWSSRSASRVERKVHSMLLWPPHTQTSPPRRSL